MFKTKIHEMLTGSRALYLAYDQGLEHGPTDFNLENVDPFYFLDIAEKGKYNGAILHHGIAEKYYQSYKQNLKLIVKLNGKTNIAKVDPYSYDFRREIEAIIKQIMNNFEDSNLNKIVKLYKELDRNKSYSTNLDNLMMKDSKINIEYDNL